jgi:hypothetical protein
MSSVNGLAAARLSTRVVISCPLCDATDAASLGTRPNTSACLGVSVAAFLGHSVTRSSADGDSGEEQLVGRPSRAGPPQPGCGEVLKGGTQKSDQAGCAHAASATRHPREAPGTPAGHASSTCRSVQLRTVRAASPGSPVRLPRLIAAASSARADLVRFCTETFAGRSCLIPWRVGLSMWEACCVFWPVELRWMRRQPNTPAESTSKPRPTNCSSHTRP